MRIAASSSLVLSALLAACSSTSTGTGAASNRVALDVATLCSKLIDECQQTITQETCDRAFSVMRVTPECSSKLGASTCDELRTSFDGTDETCFPSCPTAGSQSCNGDGTITDVVTGLMWEKKCEECGGLHDVAARYPLRAEEGRADVAAWLRDLNTEGRSGFAGYSDWRLPTVLELQSIVDYERFNPAVSSAFDGASCAFGCNDLSDPQCSCTAMTMHWTSTPMAESAKRSWAIGFNLGLYLGWGLTDERAFYAERLRGMMTTLFAHVAAKELRPETGARYRLEDFVAAFEAIKERRSVGRVILEIGAGEDS